MGKMTGINEKRVKKIWFVRHCQGEHNIDDDFDLKDPDLTQFGFKQAATISSNPLLGDALGNDPSKRAQIIVSSPLRRCLQTSIAAFEGNGIPIVPCDLIQESYAGYRPCDTGKPKSELEREFKGIDIDFDELDEDWYDIDPKISEREDTREPALRARLIQFLRWVDSRPEERIIVVGHKGIFRRMFPLPDYPIFKNAEVRLYPIDFNKPLTFPVTLAQSSVYDKAIPHVDRKPRVECGC